MKNYTLPSKRWYPRTRLSLMSLAIGCVVTTLATAQTPPSAGRVLQDNTTPSRITNFERPAGIDNPNNRLAPPITANATTRFKVSGVRFSGNTAFSAEALTAVIGDITSKEVTLADLQAAADRVSRFYRQNDYFVARAYIPAQDIKDSVLQIVVLEGTLAKIEVRQSGNARISPDQITNVMNAASPAGMSLREKDLERGLLLLRDFPGHQVKSSIRPGAATGTSDLLIETAEGSLLKGGVDIDNHGSRFTSQQRVAGNLQVNNPLQRGDTANLRIVATGHNTFWRGAYQAPIGYSGLVAGLAHSQVKYDLCCGFTNLGATGKASVSTLNAQYPILRSRTTNLSTQITMDQKGFSNTANGAITSDYKSRSLNLGLTGSFWDEKGDGGYTAYSLSLTSGNLNLDGSPSKAADALGPQVHGHFSKINYQISRTQNLAASWSIYAGLSGQTAASRNLDTSEQTALGGANAVRAYPQGEAPGDMGGVLTAELRYQLSAGVQLVGFIDHGFIKLHKNTWAGWQGANPGLPNSYSLSGTGIGVNWSKTDDYAVKAILAHKLGVNPGQALNGTDSDSRKGAWRMWLQASKYF